MSPAAVGRRGLVAAFAAALIAGSNVRATQSREPDTGPRAAATAADSGTAVHGTVIAKRLWSVARDTTPVAITGVTVIDVDRGRRVPGQTVVIRGMRVAAVGAGVAVPRGTRLVEGRGKFLIPGLWDMHVHVLTAGPRLSLLPLYVMNGVTRVRDMGGTMALDEQRAVRRALEVGERVGPVIAAAPGPILTAPGGPRDRLTGGMRLGPTLNAYVATAADARRVVDCLHAAGAGFIKLTFPPREAYLAAADQAHARRWRIQRAPPGLEDRRRDGMSLGVGSAGHPPGGASVEQRLALHERLTHALTAAGGARTVPMTQRRTTVVSGRWSCRITTSGVADRYLAKPGGSS